MADIINLTTLGYACGLAAADDGCKDGAATLQRSTTVAAQAGVQLDWQPLLTPLIQEDKYASIAEINQRLASQVAAPVKQHQPFLVVGGDHSCAIGTWSGVANELQTQGPLGLIWIDAHLDSHTSQTSLSGNIHGMPLACLLGYGDARLTQIANSSPKLQPQHVCIIGARSFETGEQDLLESLGARIFYMPEVQERGISSCFQAALELIRPNIAGYGISIDLDALDPTDAPGVGTPEANGIKVNELIQALQAVKNDNQLLGLEIVEFNPHHDINAKTEHSIAQLVKAIYG
jgi:arginase